MIKLYLFKAGAPQITALFWQPLFLWKGAEFTYNITHIKIHTDITDMLSDAEVDLYAHTHPYALTPTDHDCWIDSIGYARLVYFMEGAFWLLTLNIHESKNT